MQETNIKEIELVVNNYKTLVKRSQDLKIFKHIGNQNFLNFVTMDKFIDIVILKENGEDQIWNISLRAILKACILVCHTNNERENNDLLKLLDYSRVELVKKFKDTIKFIKSLNNTDYSYDIEVIKEGLQYIKYNTNYSESFLQNFKSKTKFLEILKD